MPDCESLHDGLLNEPANAVSSLAYVAAGIYVWQYNRVQGGALMAVGAGSVAYHGFGGPAAHVLHDGSIVAVVIALAMCGPRIVKSRYALGAMAVALPLQLFGRTGGPLCRPESLLQAHAGWHVLTAIAIAAAFVSADRQTVPA